MVFIRCSQLLTPRGPLSGGVLVDGGQILAVCADGEPPPAAVLRARQVDLGECLIAPGLVNAHTHIELSWMAAQRPSGGDYSGWLRELLALQPSFSEPTAREAARVEIAKLEMRGTVAVGDIGNDLWVAELLAQSDLEGVLFHELLGRDEARAEATFSAAEARLAALTTAAGWRHTLAPHAPHTVSPTLLGLLARRARRLGAPLSIHLAESQEEAAFLRGEGPFVELFQERNFGAPPATSARSSTAVAAAAGVLMANTAAVHAVQLDDEDLKLLARSKATVVSCPRSNDYLGVGQPRLAELLEAGVPLALGTDSLASAPDLDLFAEMQFLRQQHPQIAAQTVVQAATAGGARALGLEDRFGQIAPGMSSAMIAIELPHGADPYELLCSNPKRIQTVRSIERDKG